MDSRADQPPSDASSGNREGSQRAASRPNRLASTVVRPVRRIQSSVSPTADGEGLVITVAVPGDAAPYGPWPLPPVIVASPSKAPADSEHRDEASKSSVQVPENDATPRKAGGEDAASLTPERHRTPNEDGVPEIDGETPKNQVGVEGDPEAKIAEVTAEEGVDALVLMRARILEGTDVDIATYGALCVARARAIASAVNSATHFPEGNPRTPKPLLANEDLAASALAVLNAGALASATRRSRKVIEHAVPSGIIADFPSARSTTVSTTGGDISGGGLDWQQRRDEAVSRAIASEACSGERRTSHESLATAESDEEGNSDPDAPKVAREDRRRPPPSRISLSEKEREVEIETQRCRAENWLGHVTMVNATGFFVSTLRHQLAVRRVNAVLTPYVTRRLAVWRVRSQRALLALEHAGHVRKPSPNLLKAVCDSLVDWTFDALRDLVDCMTLTSFRAGEYVFFAGDRSRDVYFVARGNVELYVPDGRWKEKPKSKAKCNGGFAASMNHGDWFGEGALLHGEPRCASALCTIDTDLWRVGYGDFCRVASQVPEIIHRRMRRLADERRLCNLRDLSPLPRQALSEHPIIGSWHAGGIADMMAAFRPAIFRQGHVICSPSDATFSIYYVVSGSVRIEPIGSTNAATAAAAAPNDSTLSPPLWALATVGGGSTSTEAAPVVMGTPAAPGFLNTAATKSATATPSVADHDDVVNARRVAGDDYQQLASAVINGMDVAEPGVLTKGAMFGVVETVMGSPRWYRATVTTGPCECWLLSREEYMTVAMGYASAAVECRERVLALRASRCAVPPAFSPLSRAYFADPLLEYCLPASLMEEVWTSAVKARVVAAGDALFRRGDDCSKSIYFVVSGTLHIRDDAAMKTGSATSASPARSAVLLAANVVPLGQHAPIYSAASFAAGSGIVAARAAAMSTSSARHNSLTGGHRPVFLPSTSSQGGGGNTNGTANTGASALDNDQLIVSDLPNGGLSFGVIEFALQQSTFLLSVRCTSECLVWVVDRKALEVLLQSRYLHVWSQLTASATLDAFREAYAECSLAELIRDTQHAPRYAGTMRHPHHRNKGRGSVASLGSPSPMGSRHASMSPGSRR